MHVGILYLYIIKLGHFLLLISHVDLITGHARGEENFFLHNKSKELTGVVI